MKHYKFERPTEFYVVLAHSNDVTDHIKGTIENQTHAYSPFKIKNG